MRAWYRNEGGRCRLGLCVLRAVRMHVLRGVYIWMSKGFAHVWGRSFLLRTIVALCEGTVLCAVSPRGRRHKWWRLRRGCGAHRPNAAGLDCARDRRCGSLAVLLLRLWCCRSMVSVSAPIRMRCRPTDTCLCIYRYASAGRTCYREGRGWLRPFGSDCRLASPIGSLLPQ